ncbi:aromatic-L-amino-acid decarboxylase-like [Callorhinchus milii]|uniref:aromatic-L-amino-acid decarboxylase-like n=1 Tax=Callorhinchus milii TaxID=7868 RepID=UPI001C3FE462|nr:aromatic-L-amino-acid decarboxylase-like [Callorhinchus milii]
MDYEEFRTRGKEMVDYVVDYLQSIEERPVYPSVEPGYLRHLIPESAPEQPHSFEEVMKDVERVVMPGITHWHSPHFHAYFPTGNSVPGMLGDMLSNAISCIGFSWVTPYSSCHPKPESFLISYLEDFSMVGDLYRTSCDVLTTLMFWKSIENY